MFKQLDKTRVRILEILEKPMTNTEIAKTLGLSKSTVSHHLKILEKMKLVKVERTEVERNFIKKYYISTLSLPDHKFPDVFKDFKLSDREFLRALLRSLTLLNLENSVFLRKVGLNVGYYFLASSIDDDAIYDSIADLWEKLDLGSVVEASKSSFIVEDCYMCKGLPAINETYCKTDEGLLEGILLNKTGKRHIVREIRCWGTGDEECEFKIEEVKN